MAIWPAKYSTSPFCPANCRSPSLCRQAVRSGSTRDCRIQSVPCERFIARDHFVHRPCTIVLMSRRQSAERELPVAVLVMVVIVAAVAPWSVRNTNVFNTLYPSQQRMAEFALETTRIRMVIICRRLRRSTAPTNMNRIKFRRRRGAIFSIIRDIYIARVQEGSALTRKETIAVTRNTDGITQRFGESDFPAWGDCARFLTVILLLALGVSSFWFEARRSANGGESCSIDLDILPLSIRLFADERFHLPSHLFISCWQQLQFCLR